MKRLIPLFLLLLVSCEEAVVVPPEEPKDEPTETEIETETDWSDKIALDQKEIFLKTGEQAQLTVTLNGYRKECLNWKIDDPRIATISDDGLVTAVSEGATYVRLGTSEIERFRASCYVQVGNGLASFVDSVDPYAVTAYIAAKSTFPKEVGYKDQYYGAYCSTNKQAVLDGTAPCVTLQVEDYGGVQLVFFQDLVPETEYYCRSFAKFGDQIAYSELATFTTTSPMHDLEVLRTGVTFADLAVRVPFDLDGKVSDCWFVVTPLPDGEPITYKGVDKLPLFACYCEDLPSYTNFEACVYMTIGGKEYECGPITFSTLDPGVKSKMEIEQVTPFDLELHFCPEYDVPGEYSARCKAYWSSTETTAEGIIANGYSKYSSLIAYETSPYTILVCPGRLYHLVVVTDIAGKDFVSEVYDYQVADVEEMMDLGLSVKWRSWNLDASNPLEGGGFYAWGETQTKENYSLSDYKFLYTGYSPYYTVSKYTEDDTYGCADGLKVLLPEDDAVAVNLGAPWRMPTKEEFLELMKGCDVEGGVVDGVVGFRLRSRKLGYSDKAIFIPAAGFMDGTLLRYVDVEGTVWTSTVSEDISANYFFLTFNGSYCSSLGCSTTWRCYGRNVRPVCE